MSISGTGAKPGGEVADMWEGKVGLGVGGVVEEAVQTGWSQPVSAFITLFQRRCLFDTAVWQHKNAVTRSPIKEPTDTYHLWSWLGKATSHFICTTIKLHIFLSVQYSLILSPLSPFFLLLNIVNTTLKCHLYSGLLNAVLKTIIICIQFGIICVKVGNVEGKRGKQFQSTKLVIYPK